jgi:hypothetical protein
MNPQEQFLKFRKEDAETLRVESQRGWFLTSLVYAQAQVVDHGASADEINGMNRLIESVTKLAADKPEIKRLPVKTLAVLDRPTEPGADLPQKEEKK